jgi:hypothetical protein
MTGTLSDLARCNNEEKLEAKMLLMYLPFVLYSASMQMFLDSFMRPIALNSASAAAEYPLR